MQRPVIPAPSLEQRLWDIGDIVKLIEEWETQQSNGVLSWR